MTHNMKQRGDLGYLEDGDIKQVEGGGGQQAVLVKRAAGCCKPPRVRKLNLFVCVL